MKVPSLYPKKSRQYFVNILLFSITSLFFFNGREKISCMLELFYIVLWEYIVANMQIEASKL